MITLPTEVKHCLGGPFDGQCLEVVADLDYYFFEVPELGGWAKYSPGWTDNSKTLKALVYVNTSTAHILPVEQQPQPAPVGP